MEIRLVDYQSTTAAGLNTLELRKAIELQRSGLRKNDIAGCDIDTWIGRVAQADNIDLGQWQSRNNALASLGLQQGSIKENLNQLKKRFSAQRLGVVMGSSTASIDRTETAYQHLQDDGQLKQAFCQPNVHNPSSPSLFVAQEVGITGPALTINTACSSSAKIFATAARWLDYGLVDAVLVGGVDTLCLSVLYGFHSLQLLSKNPCRPFDESRDGINLGEAAAYAILMRPEDCDDQDSIALRGYGESSDAYHMSHPHPQGLGARLAIEKALAMAELKPSDIDYINLHGTASRANDMIEGQLIESMFTSNSQVSSSKAWMGHALGAAGIVEALIAVDALKQDYVPGSLNLEQLDSQLNVNIRSENTIKPLQHVMSNSFGFGGNNCCLVFSKVPGQKNNGEQ